MLLKCCTQYVSKFGKLSSGHKTGKSQFSFQPQRRAVPKKVQTAVQFRSLHMLVRLCSKTFKLGFSCKWTEIFQIYNLVLVRTEEQRSNCQYSLDHGESRGIPEKPLILLHWLRGSLWLYCCYCCSVTQSCLPLCDPMDCSTLGFPVLHYFPEFSQTHVHWVGDAI